MQLALQARAHPFCCGANIQPLSTCMHHGWRMSRTLYRRARFLQRPAFCLVCAVW